MKYIFGTIILTLVYLADFTIFALITISYMLWNFSMPNFKFTWELYHYRRIERRNVDFIEEPFKDTWNRRCKKYNFITNILKKGQDYNLS